MAAPPQTQSLIARHHEDTEVGTLRCQVGEEIPGITETAGNPIFADQQ
jgi:hypothetical protein